METALAEVDEDTRSRAILLTSEIVTNAVVHAIPPLTVSVVVGDGIARVQVTDHGRDMPVRLVPGPDDVQGRGLLVVQALASHWGVELLQAGGKTVWFELDVPAGAGQ